MLFTILLYGVCIYLGVGVLWSLYATGNFIRESWDDGTGCFSLIELGMYFFLFLLNAIGWPWSIKYNVRYFGWYEKGGETVD